MVTRLTQQIEPLPGYRLIDRLGRGGYGEVWKAEAPGGLFKAIKFVYGDLTDVDDNKAAAQELKALNRVKTIRHPFILSIERFDIIDGQLMIVMELADRNLWDRFQECRSEGLPGIPRDELLRYLDESAEALDLMNLQYQIQHLDVKPQNLFLVHNHVKVADFGLAKDFEGIRATITGGVTPVYAAPETFEGWISRFCDQYSLAIVYQELLTGVRPFTGVNSRQLLLQHLSAAPDLSSLPLSEWAIVARALSKNPDARFASCSEFVRALRAARNPSVPFESTSGSVEDPAKTQPNFKPPSPSSPVVVTRIADAATRSAASKVFQPVALKGLPALVTPAAVATSSAVISTPCTPPQSSTTSVTLQRPIALDTGHLSKLGVAAAEKLGSGVLFPVYVVGVGRIGLQVLQQLRAQIHERFGRTRFPHWKWLFIDTDPETLYAATEASSEQRLDGAETNLARLHPPAHYVKREGFPPPETWMSTEMLYRIPRDPATNGIRCLGRLAFCDHFLAISHRIRQDLEAFLTDEALIEADRQTNLGIRNNRPRVYLASSIAGGTGSGMLIDMAYVIRNEMRLMGFANPHLTGMLLTPRVDRLTPKNLAVANAHATLAELQYLSQPSNRFEARFDLRQATLADPERPFERCVLLNLPRHASNKPLAAASRAAGLIWQEALTPIGKSMDDARAEYQKHKPPTTLPLQSFGCFRISWPRQRLLETAAHHLAALTVQRWCAKDAAPVRDDVATWFEEEWRRRHLDPGSLASSMNSSLVPALGDSVDALVETELRALLADHTGRVEPAEAAAAIDRLVKLLGKPGKDEDTAPGRIHGVHEEAAKSIARESEISFAKMAVHFIEQPGFRLAAAEEAIRLGNARLQSLIDEQDEQVRQLAEESADGFRRLVPLLGSLASAGAPRSGMRRGQAEAELQALVRAWAKKRLDFLMCRSLGSIYRQMLGNAPGYLSEVNFCRHQLGDLAAGLAKQAAAITGAGMDHDHPVLGAECKTLLKNATRIIEKIPLDDLKQFEECLQQELRRECRALLKICLAMGEHGPRLEQMLVEHARTLVDARLGRHSTAEELFDSRPDEESIRREIQRAYDESAPEIFGQTPRNERQCCILAIASDEYGKRLERIVHDVLPQVSLVVAESADDVVLYREYHDLTFADLPQSGNASAQVAGELRSRDRIETHCRTDVQWPG